MLPAGYMIWMALGWTILLVVIAGIFWIVLKAFRGPSRLNESPERILKRRLAAGEIDAAEYTKRLAALAKTKHAA